MSNGPVFSKNFSRSRAVWINEFRYTSRSHFRGISMRHLLMLAFFLTATAFADTKVIDRTGSWDVNAPLGPSALLEFTTDEGTWMNLDVHPDGTEIIFDLLGDLYVVSIEGGPAKRLTEGAAYDMQPRFSPDGTRILFNSDRGSVKNAWIADYDGESLSDIRVVTEQSGNMINAAAWTADGEWVLARKRVTDVSSIGIAELWLYDKNGGNGIQVMAPRPRSARTDLVRRAPRPKNRRVAPCDRR